jgi:hypothetical protein
MSERAVAQTDEVANDEGAGSELLLYQSDDGETRLEVRLVDGGLWLTQRQLAALYQVGVPSINEHIRNIYDEGELAAGPTIRKFRIVGTEGNRSVSRSVDHYALPMAVAVGYRVRSPRGTQFRQWAAARLLDYLVKGFAIDDRRLKHPPGSDAPDYFNELLAKIRDIRSSEKVFYKKVLDIYATSIDYDPRAPTTQQFFAAVQNKMHWAAHGHTAAEIIAARADASKPNMGLTAWAGARPRRADIFVAKNYLTPDEIDALNRIVSAYLELAELQATNRRPMTMADWSHKLDEFLKLSERDVLDHVGSITHEVAAEKAQQELDRYDAELARLASPVEEHFEAAARTVTALAKRRPGKPRKRT